MLTSSRLVLRFGDYFELRATLRPGEERAVDSVELCGLETLQPAAGAALPPHIVVLRALFSRVQVSKGNRWGEGGRGRLCPVFSAGSTRLRSSPCLILHISLRRPSWNPRFVDGEHRTLGNGKG